MHTCVCVYIYIYVYMYMYMEDISRNQDNGTTMLISYYVYFKNVAMPTRSVSGNPAKLAASVHAGSTRAGLRNHT